MVTNVWRVIKVKRINYKYCVALPVNKFYLDYNIFRDSPSFETG